MTEPHLICIDIDGTLLDGQSDCPPRENLEAICEVRRQGHKVFINTGRAWANIPQGLRDVLDCFDGFCCANGSYVRTRDRVLRNITFPEPLLFEALQYFIREDPRFCLFEGETLLLKTGVASDLYGSPGVMIHHPEEIHTRFQGCRFNVFSCEGRLSEAFHQKFSGRIHIFQCDTFADCAPLGCSKAIGMQYAAAHCAIPMTHTVAIGDSANDLPMLQSAAVSVAMGNSPEDIRRQADFVTDSHENCGVAQILRKLFPSR